MSSAAPTTNYDKFVRLLKELFMFDQADLDFGIYRVMNVKRDEITRFLQVDLLPQVRETLGALQSGERKTVDEELAAATEAARRAGVDPDQAPRVRELRGRLEAVGGSLDAIEAEVFSDLYNFFRRYYDEGDFISQRRYKEGVYAIPYEGEEVKLYWANHDQYYIKSSENFRNYSFKVSDGRRVTFKLVEADTERDNNRLANGNERRFILCEAGPLVEENSELIIRFEYRPDADKRKQDKLNEIARDAIFGVRGFDAWTNALASRAPTPTNPDRTVLERHIKEYTARNTFDYFIHKDLSKFLCRELDFYIKNEIVHLDDIEHDEAPRIEQYLAKVKAIRHIAHKIIDLLAQIEDFQRKLWLKKKFVVETNYCITLDRIPEGLYPEIAANEAQRKEWIELFRIDDIAKDLHSPGYSTPLTVEFLKANPYLSLNTRLFPSTFKSQLLASFRDIDNTTDGLLINSDNSQALRLIASRFRNSIRATYIDPPYNTPHSEILYKNNYLHSTWLSLLANTFEVAPPLWAPTFSLGIAVDDFEFVNLAALIDGLFPALERSVVVVNHHPQGAGGRLSRTHEYLVLASPKGAPAYQGRPREDGDEDRTFMRSGTAENNFRAGRWRSFYALLMDPRTRAIVSTEKPVPLGTEYPVEPTEEGLVRIYPINSRDEERVWRSSYESGTAKAERNELGISSSGAVYQRISHEGKRETLFSNWTASEFNAGIHGTGILTAMGLGNAFDYPKAVNTVEVALWAQTFGDREAVILDYFAGSGTTAHAVLSMNRHDDGERKYVLVEQGAYFNSVLLPRVRKAAYSNEWQEGKPSDRIGVSHTVKYVRLESYEDALNNIKLQRQDDQSRLLDEQSKFREDYVLRYALQEESRGSASLLNVSHFTDPFHYKMEIATDSVGEVREVDVDLIETFNWLLGLRVNHIDTIRGVRVVEGTNPSGEKVIVLWRNVTEVGNDALDEWFAKQGYNTRDQEYDLVYVNGDNNLENLRRNDQTWKVRLIEDDFHRLMFDTHGL